MFCSFVFPLLFHSQTSNKEMKIKSNPYQQSYNMFKKKAYDKFEVLY